MDCLPRNRNGRDRPSSGTGAHVVPSMSMPARMRESASMAAMTAAPPMEWPAIAIRDGSHDLTVTVSTHPRRAAAVIPAGGTMQLEGLEGAVLTATQT